MLTLDDLMARFSVVELGGEAVVIEDFEPGKGPDGSSFKIMRQKTFEDLYRNHTIAVESKDIVKQVKLTKHWLDHPGRKTYHGFGYNIPGGVPLPPNYYDGWRGFTVTPKAGSWEKNKLHLYNIVCAGNDANFDWVMNWLAAMFQKPGKNAGTAIVLRGKQGSGKGYFARDMVGGCFYAQQYLQVLGGNELTGEFNEHLSGKVFIFADEAIWGGSVMAANRLKSMITEPRITINRKFLKIESEPSALHIVAASNENWAVHVDAGDRRYSVLDVSNDQRLNRGYFGELFKELADGGRAAMLAELLALEVDWDLVTQPLMSTAKVDLLKQSWTDIEHWWDNRLMAGTILENAIGWDEWVKTGDLHDDYMKFQDMYHKQSREKRVTKGELWIFFKKFRTHEDVNQDTKYFVNTAHRFSGQVHRGIQFPSLEECRKRWLEVLHLPATYSWTMYSDQSLSEPHEETSFEQEDAY